IRERGAGNVTVLAQVLAGAQQDANLAAAAKHALSLWIAEIETTLVRLLKGSPLSEVANPEGLARGIAASFIGIELFEGVDPEGAQNAIASLETLGILVEVVEDLGPVARRALRTRVRRTARPRRNGSVD
ncbi:MAG TPA: TetR/AcrR family transcriptional regulator, partial [Acidothermaceae bacterium]